VQTSAPSGPTHQIQLGRVVQGAEKSTQFPSAIEDALDRPPRVILARFKGLKKVDPLLERLTKSWNEIGRLRRHLEVAKRWTTHKDSLTEESAKTWLDLEEGLSKKLRKLEDEFWELNVPDREERARLRILEGVAYLGQKEGLERDLTDLLTDDRFPQVKQLGSGLKRPRSESLPSVPKKGPVLPPLGYSPTDNVDGIPGTRDRIVKRLIGGIVNPEDQPKGKEPRVSRTQNSTRTFQSQSDLSTPGGEQDRKVRPKRLNPQRRRALREREGFDTRAPRGAPTSREEVDTSRRGRTKSEERARRTEPKGSRVTNGPPEGGEVTPLTQIDLTGESPAAGATPPTPTQGEGRADPKGPGEGQEVGEQRASGQENPPKVR
jgi:hypothetical protein